MDDLSYILGLVKSVLGITGTTRDEELNGWIEGAIGFISSYTKRPIRSEDVLEIRNGGKYKYNIKYPTDEISTLEYRVDYTRTAETIIENSIQIDYRSLYFVDKTTCGIKNLRLGYTAGRTLEDATTSGEIGTLPSDLYSVIVNYVVAVDKLNSTGAIDGIKSEKLSDYQITFKTSTETDSGNILLSSSDKTTLDTYTLFDIS